VGAQQFEHAVGDRCMTRRKHDWEVKEAVVR
jgi:hypothetical protein